MPGEPVVGRTRQIIFDEATRLFGAQGYAGTTMRDIATAVGLLPGSLYTHIQGKENLLLEIVESGIDRFLAIADGVARSGAGPDQKLRALIKDHVGVVAQNPERTLVVFHQWRYLTGEARERVVEKRSRYEDAFRKIMNQGRRSGVFAPGLDLKVSVLAVLGALNWTAEWYRPDGPDTVAEIGERLADTLMSGLLTRAS
ncbi:TetR/AcrR family transcriptional regulator [Nakamurella alba]|nr:TetR/AcrR family transcriptional regulator [Nakamurella alba]